MKRITATLVLFAVAVAGATSKPKPAQGDKYFYVYSDKGAQNSNKFAPSGWMGDYGDLKLNDADTENPVDGRTCIKVTYNAKGAQGANWAGIYWQHPPNNWAKVPNAGYDLSAYKKVTFWARGAQGGEKLAKFCAGGINGEYPDSDGAETEPLLLTKDWKLYTLDLTGKDFRNVSGGFCWAASKDDNPDGFTIYLDEIRYEK
jgi:hypothetical protein